MNDEIKRGRTESMGQSLAAVIGPRIVAGTLETPVTAETLIREYAVSRTVVRDALAVLRAKGMVAMKSGEGVTVQPTGRWNLLDADVLRWLVPYDAGLAAEARELAGVLDERGAGPLAGALISLIDKALA